MKHLDLMNLKTCNRCGKIYETFLDINNCPKCHRLLEEQLDMVKTFMGVNVSANMEEISIALKVPSKQLLAWAREERIEFSESSGVVIPCLKCRGPIRQGKYCVICKAEIMADLESVYEKPEVGKTAKVIPTKSINKMHHFNNRRKR